MRTCICIKNWPGVDIMHSPKNDVQFEVTLQSNSGAQQRLQGMWHAARRKLTLSAIGNDAYILTRLSLGIDPGGQISGQVLLRLARACRYHCAGRLESTTSGDRLHARLETSDTEAPTYLLRATVLATETVTIRASLITTDARHPSFEVAGAIHGDEWRIVATTTDSRAGNIQISIRMT